MDRRGSPEQALILAAAYYVGQVNRLHGTSFSVSPATRGADYRQGTDVFLYNGEVKVVEKLDGTPVEREQRIRIDLTVAAPPKSGKPNRRGRTRRGENFFAAKIRGHAKHRRGGGFRVLVVHAYAEQARSVYLHPCFPQAYEAFILGNDGRRLALEEACPEHGNRCALAERLRGLAAILNTYLPKKFQMPAIPPLPSR